ncbi:hypothetical protein B0G57_103270 [Trinickia symbiotica]|nr:hypothetical protein B0G57_103270 [Trinickia symbiotica]
MRVRETWGVGRVFHGPLRATRFELCRFARQDLDVSHLDDHHALLFALQL